MELCRTAVAFVVCLFVPVLGQPCTCASGCDSNEISSTLPNTVNIAYGKTSNMSERFNARREEAGPACLAVDGKNSTTYVERNIPLNNQPNPTFAYNCIHSQLDDYDPWWYVDLGRLFSVTDITIYRRKGAARRMAGLSVLVDGQLCYSFPNSSDTDALDRLEEKINVTCKPPLTGRVVRLQKHGLDTDGQFYFINICEVQVWACTDGLYGAQCGQTCSGHCKDNVPCDNYYGKCHGGCRTGYRGDDCRCGHCRGGADCDVTTLRCPGCDKGWGTQFCNQSCTDGTHGYDCGEQCGQCANSDTCNTTTGLCPNGCQSGWQGDDCKQECADGYYGQRCMSRCGNCSDGGVCDKVNGTCPTGCQPGFDPSDRLCESPCQNKQYGAECANPCGMCQNNAPCDAVNGHCDVCQPNLLLPLCQVCEKKMYGAECDTPCSTQCGGDGSCHRNNGTCQAGCASGYLLGSGFCDEACENGTFGPGCGTKCGKCAESRCNHKNGTCEVGCMDGYGGDMCSGQTSEPPGPGDSAGLTTIIGAVVGGVVLIAIIIIIVVIVRRRRRNPKHTGAGSSNATGGRASETENIPHGTTLSFEPIQEPEVKSKLEKPSAMVKPTVMKKPKMKNSEDADESAHIYYNTANTATPPSASPTPSSAAPSPASASTSDSPSQQAQAPARPQSPVSTRQVADPADYDEDNSGAEGDNVYYNDDEDVYASFQATQPMLDAVQKYLVDVLASGKLKEEFATLESMPEGVPQEIALLKKNFKKNRFAAVLPYDRNLVVLRDGYSEGTATDFVNASYVSGYQLDKQFIAAQGPRDNTVGDLWRMIWQEQITHVVMLTNIQERGKPKCELYWPEEEGGVDTFGPVTVTTTHVQCRDDFFIRTFSVKRAGSDESREVTQYHYVSWPDHGAPTTTSLVTFWRYVHNRTKPADGASVPPVLVHCSAGVGRTGTYIGLEIGVDMAVNEGHINVLDLVKRLREKRCLMVQALDQYLFLHKALLEAYTAHGTNVSVDEFDAMFTGHITSDKPHPRVDKEFQTLQQMLTLTPAHHHHTASLEENMAKNRNPDILPSDEHLVFLTEHVSGQNQYINAVFMPTFRDHRGSIVTQLPLPSTLVDFWRLVYGNDVSAIVSLSSPNEEQEVKPYCQYWPINEGKTLTFGPYSVYLTSKTERRGSKVTSYSLNLAKKGVKSVRVVELLQYKGWTGKVGGSTSDIRHLIDTLVTLQENTNTDRLVVQCSDGVGKSGLFCALCDIINRMTYDREVDVYMTVRHMQSVTPKALSSVTQYRYCYEVVQSRVREMSVYANAPQR